MAPHSKYNSIKRLRSYERTNNSNMSDSVVGFDPGFPDGFLFLIRFRIPQRVSPPEQQYGMWTTPGPGIACRGNSVSISFHESICVRALNFPVFKEYTELTKLGYICNVGRP